MTQEAAASRVLSCLGLEAVTVTLGSIVTLTGFAVIVDAVGLGGA